MFPCAQASVKTPELYVPTRTCTRSGLSCVAGIWHHSVPLLITGFHIIHFFEHSLIRTMIAHSCSTFVRNLQWVLHLRHCVPSWICGLSSCRHLLGLVQLLPVSFHSVLHALVYLSRLLIVAVANELVTLMCVSLSVSASQGRKQRGTDLVRDTVRVHFHLAGVTTGSVSQEAVSVHIPGQLLSA